MVENRHDYRRGLAVKDEQEEGFDRSRFNYHYDRERRLERATEPVRRTYTEGYTPNKGFIKGLTANTGLKSILMVIVMLSLTLVALNVLGDPPGTVRIQDSKAALKAFLFDDKIYVNLVFAAKESSSRSISVVSAIITGLDGSGNVVAEREIAGAWSNEPLALRTIFEDFDIVKVNASIMLDGKVFQLTVSVDRN